MKKKSIFIIILMFTTIFFSGISVQGEDKKSVYPRIDVWSRDITMEEKVPIRTFVIENRGYSVDEVNSVGNENLIEESKKVLLKTSENIWIDYKSKKKVDKNSIPEIEYLDEWGNTIVFAAGDGAAIQDKMKKAVYVIYIQENQSGIGSVVKSLSTPYERYENAGYFSICSTDGAISTGKIEIGRDGYIYPGIEEISKEGQVDIVLYDKNEERLTRFKNLEIDKSRIIITDKSEVEKETIYVNNVQELLEAVGPKRKIVMKKGTYNLSGYYSERENDGEYISRERVGLVIQNVSGLVLEGEDKDERVKFVSGNADLYVACFANSDNLVLKNLQFELINKEVRPISAAVIMTSTDGVTIDNCEFNGFGKAISIGGSKNISINNSVMQKCNNGIGLIEKSEKIKITNCIVNNNIGENGFKVSDSDYIVFQKNVVENNKLNGLLFKFYDMLGKSEDDALLIEDCVFENNDFYTEKK